MLSKHEEQEERHETLENDRRVREQQGSTFMSHTHNDTGGRFSSVSNPTVVGSVPSPASHYPAGPNWCAADQELEPPFPIDVNALEPTGEIAELKASISRPLGPSMQAKATSSAVPLAEHGDPTAVLPPAQSGRRIFRRNTFRRA